MRTETILNVLPGADEFCRLVVALESEQGCDSRMVLRQETRSGDIDWFVQSRVAIDPEQVAGLKMMLTSGAVPTRSSTSGFHSRGENRTDSGLDSAPATIRFQPVVHAAG